VKNPLTPTEDITVKGWKRVSDVYWAADSKSLLVSSSKDQVPVVLHVDLQGNARVLWEVQGGTNTYAVPSPDGRHLAMQKMTNDGNLWMMENF
jgi:Tol biopolymer transport system component